MPIKGNSYISDTGQFGSITVTSNGTTNFNSTIIRNIGRAIELTDAVTLGQLLESSSLASTWANFPATNNVNMTEYSIYSTNSQTFTTANRTFYLDAIVLSNISTQAASAASGGAGDWSLFAAKTDINVANYIINNVSSVRLINSDATGTISVDYGLVYGLSTISGGQPNSNIRYDGVSTALLNVSTTAGEALSTGQGLVPRVDVLETFSTAQTTSNVRYDAVSTATSEALSTGQGLVPRVEALETFSAAQITSNIRYDIVSTTFTGTSTVAGQAFSTGEGLVPRVGALETFSTNQLTSNIRYDGVSTAFTGLSNNVYLLSTSLISTISSWTGTYVSSDPTLVGRVTALETFSTSQSTMNSGYDIVSTAFTATSTTTGQAFSTGQGLVPSVVALEIFSTGQFSSNIRYDGVSTAFSTLSRGYFLLSTTLISTISTWTGTYAGSGGGTIDPTLVGRVAALETFSTNQTTSNIRYDAVSTALLTVSTTSGQAFSTGQGLVPRVGALETFSANQLTSNIRYDGVSTAFSTLSRGYFLLSTTLISTISTWTGTYAGSGGGTTDPTLVGRVAALETFSTSQSTMNNRYDLVSTAFTATSSATGQSFSTGQGLVPRVGALETFSANQLTSNIRYDGVSTAFSTLSRGYFLLSTTLISTISTWTGTYAGSGGGTIDPTLVGRVADLETFSTNQTTSNIRYDGVSTALLTVSTTSGQAFSTGQGLVPRVGALETFSANQLTSNIRYDGVSTAFSTLSRGYFLLSTTLISTISTWTGTYAGSGGGTTDPTLVGRVAALETFSTSQSTMNNRYDLVSTAFTATSSATGQAFSTGQGLVSRVGALETFSANQLTSNIRYDGVSTALLTVSTTTGQSFSTGQGLVPRVGALETFSANQLTSNIRYDGVSTALLTVSTTTGQAFSTGQGLVPRVGALETFSANQLTSNIRYDGVSTAFIGLSNNVYLLSTTLISTISTWTGTYAGSGGGTTDPTLVGRVAALETFSTSQSTMNNSYDLVSTAFTATSTTTGQTFSTVTSLNYTVSSIINPFIQTSTNLSTLSYYTLSLVSYNIITRDQLSSQVVSNVRYDGVSTAFSTLAQNYFLLSTTLISTISTWTGTYGGGGGGGGSDPTLVGRVAALETFSTTQLTSNTFYTTNISTLNAGLRPRQAYNGIYTQATWGNDTDAKESSTIMSAISTSRIPILINNTSDSTARLPLWLNDATQNIPTYPTQATDIMRFIHVGTFGSNSTIILNLSNNNSLYDAIEMSAGESITLIWNGGNVYSGDSYYYTTSL